MDPTESEPESSPSTPDEEATVPPNPVPTDQPSGEKLAQTEPDLGLSGRRLALYGALVHLDQRFKTKGMALGHMYLGALRVRTSIENPDRLALACHGIRELMEKLPRYLDVPILRPASIVGEVHNLRWQHAVIARRVHCDGYQAEVVAFFEGPIANFFGSIDTRHTPISERAGKLIDRLDPRQTPIPAPIKQTHADVWNKCEKFFIDVSHHRYEPSEEEVDGYLEELENFLLDRLRPRTFDDQAELKRIIELGEGNDRS
jgi:hypothetical protein